MKPERSLSTTLRGLFSFVQPLAVWNLLHFPLDFFEIWNIIRLEVANHCAMPLIGETSLLVELIIRVCVIKG